MVSAPPQLKLLNWDKKSKKELETRKGGLRLKGLSLRWGGCSVPMVG